MAASLVKCCRSNFPSLFKKHLSVINSKSEYPFKSYATSIEETKQTPNLFENENEVDYFTALEGDDAHYPPIQPEYPAGHDWGDMPRKLAWMWDEEREKVSQLKTAQEKIKHLTEKTYKTWNYRCPDYHPRLWNYQLDKTKTYMNHDLIDLYKDVNTEGIAERLKPLVIEAIEMQNSLTTEKLSKFFSVQANTRQTTHHYIKEHFKYDVSHLMVKTILSTIYSHLSGEFEHIYNCQFDENVNVAACWERHGVERHKNYKLKLYKNYELPKSTMFFAEHDVDFQIRKPLPLGMFELPIKMSQVHDYKKFPYHPAVVGQHAGQYPRKINAGYNIGDPCEFTHLSVVISNHKMLHHNRTFFGEDGFEEAVNGYALSTSFLSTIAQAHYQGFNMHEELAYPVTTQTIVSDGHKFKFSAYQLNTIQLWLDDKANPVMNHLFMTENSLPLYDTIEDGVVQGFNDNTFSLLLKSILIEPMALPNFNLRPNLSDECAPLETSSWIPIAEVPTEEME